MVRMNLTAAGAWPLPGQPVNALQTAAGPLFFGAMTLDRLRLLGARSPGWGAFPAPRGSRDRIAVPA